MLNHRIRDILFHKKKKGYFASILFGKSVFEKIHHHSVLQRTCERCKHRKKPAKYPLFDWINKMMSDKQRQAKFSGFASC